MTAQFKESAQCDACSSNSEAQSAKQGEVPCDICTGTKLKALKSCLVCLVSYCETHLDPHLTLTGLKSHQLVDPLVKLEDRLCKKHNKPLELFCNEDQTCVCMLCTVLDRKTLVVTLRDAREAKKTELETTLVEIQTMVQSRQLKMDEFKLSVKLSREDADREKKTGAGVFAIMRQIVEKCLNEVIDTVEEKQRATEKQAEGLISELEQETLELRKRRAEMQQLLGSADDLEFLQRFQTLATAAPMKDWTQVIVAPPICEGTVRRATNRFVKYMEDSKEQFGDAIQRLQKAELKKLQQFPVDVELDPDTANPELSISEDGKQVKWDQAQKTDQDNLERFSQSYGVLGKKGFSSGRIYFEVEVKGTKWDVGVVRRSVNRKGGAPLSPQHGYWTVGLRNNIYTGHDEPPVNIPFRHGVRKVGVFVDFTEGVVSFYDVDHPGVYGFTDCCFTEELYPFCSPGGTDSGKNCPLIITPIAQTE